MKTKLYRIKFLLQAENKDTLWQYINTSLFKKVSTLAQNKLDNIENRREFVRVVFKELKPCEITVANKKIPAYINNISLGGAELSLADAEALEFVDKKELTVHMEFITPAIHINACFQKETDTGTE